MQLIDDSKREDKDLLSDEVIEPNKDRIRQATDKQNLFKFLPSFSTQPVNPSSIRIKLARKIAVVKRGGKNLEGLYETIPERASIVKTSNSSFTIRVPGRPDTEVHMAQQLQWSNVCRNMFQLT